MTVVVPTPPPAGVYTLQATNGSIVWTPQSSQNILRAAFAYPWFPAAWTQNGIYPFTNFVPSAGYYTSNSMVTTQRLITAMQYGHLDAGISSWWGQGSQEDAVVPVLLSTAAAMNTGFKWTLYYEPEGIGDPSVAQILNDLTYIKSKYAGSPNYLHIDGKPVIFVYADGNDGVGMVQRWQQANSVAGFYVVLKVFPGYQAVASDVQGWHQYGPANAVDHQVGYSFTISPGYYKKGDPAPMLARSPAAWASNVAAMVASNEPIQLITTLSEWGEGTVVESAQEWATPSGFGTYLDVLHDVIPSR